MLDHRTFDCSITVEEWRLLGVEGGNVLPNGGQRLIVRIISGTGTATVWTELFNPIFQSRFGVTLFPGSLNLTSDHPVAWAAPVLIQIDTIVAEFCPIILEEAAVGVAFRGNAHTPTLLEVLSPVNLRKRMQIGSDGGSIEVRLLPGACLNVA